MAKSFCENLLGREGMSCEGKERMGMNIVQIE